MDRKPSMVQHTEITVRRWRRTNRGISVESISIALLSKPVSVLTFCFSFFHNNYFADNPQACDYIVLYLTDKHSNINIKEINYKLSFS